MFSFVIISQDIEKAECFAPVKRLAGNIVCEMTYIVLIGTSNSTQRMSITHYFLIVIKFFTHNYAVF